jgi:D-3-phosphoglycerate dehydrogenase
MRRGIVVANVADYCIDEVADHAVALLLAANRHLIPAYHAARSGVWGTEIMRGTERLSTQTVGIVGFGRIGQAVARKIMVFVRRVLAFDPVVPAAVMTAEGAEPADLSTLLRSSDYVSLHCPLMPETRHLFDARALAQMKPHAWLINTSRGELIEESALIDALTARTVGGAALDVRATEPPAADDPLLALDNVLLTPHVAWYSESAVGDLRYKAAEQVRLLLHGEIRVR